MTSGFDLGKSPVRDNLINTLMDHYSHNVANILQPVLHSRNAYNSYYATEALAVAKYCPWTDVVQRRNVSDSRVALLCSLLTSSSFHMRGFDKSHEADALARYFRGKALSHLRMALDSLQGFNGKLGLIDAHSMAKYEAVLSVTLTLVTADVSSTTYFYVLYVELTLPSIDRF